MNAVECTVLHCEHRNSCAVLKSEIWVFGVRLYLREFGNRWMSQNLDPIFCTLFFFSFFAKLYACITFIKER